MAAVTLNPAQLAAMQITSTSTAKGPASTASSAPASQPGFSGRSSFDSSGSSGRSSTMAQGFWPGQEAILGRSNATTDWHKLKMEMIALLK